ncbi:MAG TPA: glucose-1-phosphate adenylyltransferase subunit GlgD [Lachnospiraceae bacterium]|nr:glucose-1-phosphate adenylyltransferase subunit GlgD [Lachnospiraceae bacterium]
MKTENTNALGIIFPNIYDELVPELTSERLMASLPFASRYRIIDFVLSSMVSCGIDNIAVLVRKNYFSLLDHLGSGREWDLTRKNGGLTIFPPFAEKNMDVSSGKVSMIANLTGFLKSQREKYVILSDANIVSNFDFNALLDTHIESGADVTVAYTKQKLPQSIIEAENTTKSMYYTIDMDGTRVKKININSKEEGIQNFSMNTYVFEREKLVQLVNEVLIAGGIYLERDVLMPRLGSLNIHGYEYKEYVARIDSLKGYFDENMKLLDNENLDALFGNGKNPIHTKVRDDNPTRYITGASAKNVMVADGCVIEGDIENSILFRGVKVGKGAKVKNSILMQDTVVGEGANVDYVITDKKVQITEGKELKGTDTFPVFIAKKQVV